MPERVESTLLVLEHFKDPAGTEWRKGDRASLHRRSVRLAALEHPEWFAMEWATEPVDAAWLAELDQRYDAEYEEARKRRDEREAGRERALRDELRTQDIPQPELERRYAKQEAEKAEREKKAREEHKRQRLETQLAVQRGSGFHFTD